MTSVQTRNEMIESLNVRVRTMAETNAGQRWLADHKKVRYTVDDERWTRKASEPLPLIAKFLRSVGMIHLSYNTERKIIWEGRSESPPEH